MFRCVSRFGADHYSFLGRSTGAGALSAWTHNLKSTEHLNWSDQHYKGPALKIGAGVQGFEAIDAAADQGLVVVGGYCPTVGLAGGYIQGAGHSPLGTKFGMAADQTLEFEVVTTAGDIVIASRNANPDLYWALSGGGPGTYGIVTAVTIRAYPDVPIGGAKVFIFDFSTVSSDAYWNALTSLYSQFPAWVDAGLHATLSYNSTLFYMDEVTGYNMTSQEVKAILEPWTSVLDNLSIPYISSYSDHASYRDHWLDSSTDGPVGTFWQTGGRLVPRETLEHPQSLATYIAALRHMTDQGMFLAETVVAPTSKTGAPNAVLPAWRNNVALHATLQPWDFSPTDAAWAQMQAEQREGTYDFDPSIDRAVPGTGNYMNEADPFRPDWKEAFFGENYDALLSIKDKWDPDGILYGRETVGGDRWTVSGNGRTCRVSNWS